MGVNVKSRENIRIVSRWGNSYVWELPGSNRAKIYRPDGSVIKAKTNKKGQGETAKSEELKQIELFSPDNDY